MPRRIMKQSAPDVEDDVAAKSNVIPLNIFDDDEYEVAEEHEAEAMDPGGLAGTPEETPPQETPAAAAPEPQTSQPAEPAQPSTPEQWARIAQENADLREKWARLESRQQVINQALTQQQALEQQQQAAAQQQAQAQAILAQRPDPAIDPQGAELFDLRLRQALQEQYAMQQQQAVAQALQAQQQQVMAGQRRTWVDNDFNFYAQHRPDILQALNHLVNYRWQQLLRLSPPEEAQRVFNGEVAYYIDSHWRSNQSLADFVYNWAQQVGYQPPQQQPQPQPQQQIPQQNGGIPPRIAQQQRGQSMQGMGYTTPGASPDRMPTMMDIANMSDEEFTRWRARVGPGRADFILQQLELAEG